MPGPVRVHILDPSGARSVEVTIEEAPIVDALARLATRFGYPTDKIEGRPIRYHLFHREGKTTLAADAPLSADALSDGDTLYFFPAAVGTEGPS